jgi:hypothetical protein
VSFLNRCYNSYQRIFEPKIKRVAEKLLTTDVTWNPHPPTPSPAGEGEQNPYYFLVPLSCGRGARGEGFTDFHVTPVTSEIRLEIIALLLLASYGKHGGIAPT